MAFTVNKKGFCVLEFAKTESIVTVSDHVPHRTIYRQNNSWMVHEFQQSGCLCAAKRTGRPGLWAIFLHDYPLAVEPGSTPRPLVKKTWRDSPPIDMLLSVVSVLVVAQSSSEIPEGLMNNPVLRLLTVCGKSSDTFSESFTSLKQRLRLSVIYLWELIYVFFLNLGLLP